MFDIVWMIRNDGRWVPSGKFLDLSPVKKC